jgi:hypothetical protein
MSNINEDRRELTESLAAGDPALKAHLDGLTEEGFVTLLKLGLHRADPQRFPHPGSGLNQNP